MPKSKTVLWLSSPEEDNYPAAISYLSLLYPERVAGKIVSKLRRAKVVQFKAKDIFRASQLSLLGVSNSHVKKDQKKIRKGLRLSPLLLVRDPEHGKVIIADGYHRLCAIYQTHEDILICCKIV
jgi:hypothetical protein